MHEPEMKPLMDEDEVEAFLRAEFPQMYVDGEVFSIDAVKPGRAVVGFHPAERHLRPGGTVSGPTLFTLADVTAYIVIIAHIGPVALAVTTNMSINFLHRPALGPLAATGTILKLGKRLVVTDLLIRDRDERVVAQATGTYSVPPRP